MQGILYEEPTFWLFALVTIIMGGWAAWRAGIALAKTWKPAYMLVPYMLILGCAVRFIHFAMFEGTLFTLQYYTVDTVCIFVFSVLGWRHQRAESMARQYAFAFEKTSPFSWSRSVQVGGVKNS